MDSSLTHKKLEICRNTSGNTTLMVDEQVLPLMVEKGKLFLLKSETLQSLITLPLIFQKLFSLEIAEISENSGTVTIAIWEKQIDLKV